MHKIAVRELAYFVYQSGNLTNSNSFNQKAIDGKYLHQIRQSEYDGESQKEYYIAKVIKYQNVEYEIHGYIDGLLESRKQLVLEEIKTTDNNVYEEVFLEKPEHLAQLKIYGYLMLLDEPTKGIDATAKEKLASLIVALSKHMTIVCISHDLEFSAKISDRVAMLFNGQLESIDTMRNFFKDNLFYTTTINKIMRQVNKEAVLLEDLL